MFDGLRNEDNPGLLPLRPARLDAPLAPAPARSWWRRLLDIWPHVMAGVMAALAVAGFVL